MNAFTLSPTVAALLSVKPTANIAIPQTCHERQMRKSLAAQLSALPYNRRVTFLDSMATSPHHTYLVDIHARITGVERAPKHAAKPYSNRYGRKSTAKPVQPAKSNEQRENLPALPSLPQLPKLPQLGTLAPAKPPSFKQLQLAKKSATTPAAKVGKQDECRAIAAKAADKYAKATEKIMSKSKGFGGNAMTSLNKSHSAGEKPTDHYGEMLRETAGAAGL